MDLRKFLWNRKYSQRGEDGVIAKIFESLQIENGFFVELGGWDGIVDSNTHLLAENGFSGVYIECDDEKFLELEKNIKKFNNVHAIKSKISLEEGNTLDDNLKKANTPLDFDILSLDVDGNDYWIWGTTEYKPKVVIVEYNSNWEESCTIKYDPDHIWDDTQYFGASATALKNLADFKGYDLVAHVPNCNLIFVDKKYNNGKFDVLSLEEKYHVSKNHHKPMSPEQKNKLVFSPPVEPEEIKKFILEQ